MIYLAKGGSWLTLGQIVSSIASFLSAIAFANLLPQETYGTYKFVLSTVAILTIPTLKGINTAIGQAVTRGYEGSFPLAINTKIRWGLLGGLASLGLSGYYFINGNITLTLCFLIAAVFLPFMDSFNIYIAFLQGKKLFDMSMRFTASARIISVGAIIFILFLTNNIFLILITYFISNTLSRFIILKIILKKFKLNKKEDSKTISYGKHLSLVGVVGSIASYLDRILIFHFLGPIEVATYSFAIALPEQIKGYFRNIPTLALPRLSKRSFEEINSVLYKRLLKLFIIGGLIAGTYILAAPFIFKIFFPKYLDSIFFSQIFTITIVLLVPTLLLGVIGQSKLTIIPKRMLYWVNISPPIILIISLLLLIKPLGILGVVMARIIFSLVTFIITLIFWKKLKKLSSNDNTIREEKEQ